MKWVCKAIDQTGALVDIERESASRVDLLREAKADGLTLISVTEVESSNTAAPTGLRGLSLPWVGIRPRTITLFTRQLSDLTEAGIPLTESIHALKSFEPSQRFAASLNEVYSTILQGNSFSDALAKQPEVFPKLYVSMVRVGETTGKLSEVLGGLANFRERDEEIRDKIRGALAYPLFTLAFSVLLVYGLVAYVLPGFEPIWTGAGLNLSHYPITEFLLGLSRLTHTPLDEILAVVLIFGIWTLYRKFMTTPEAQFARDSMIMKIPVLKDFAELGVMSRITNTLSTLVQSGVNLVQAVNLTAETADNAIYEEALKTVSLHLQQGAGLAEAFGAVDQFPPMLVQVVAIAERGGNLADMMPRVAHYYDRQLEGSLKTLSSLVEPATMVIVGGIVFIFVLGVFLPIIGIVQSLNSQVG